MANRVVSWVLTAHDRTGAAFASLDRKLRAARQSTDDNRRSMDGLDSSARRTARGMDDNANAISRSGRAARGATRDNDGFRNSLVKLAGSAGFLKSMLLLLGIPAVAMAANLAGAAIRSLTAGFFALGGAIGPAAGGLAVLPGLMAAVAQAATVTIFATSGIGAALKAMSSDQLNAGRTASQAASRAAAGMKRQEAATEAVRSATRSLAQAQQQASDQMASAMRQVEQAQRRLTESQGQALAAQERLSEARRRASRDLEELRRRVQRLALSEEDAIFALQDAADQLAQAQIWQGFAPDDEVFRRADLAYRKAVANLEDVQAERSQANEELEESERRGVEGSDAVVEAMRGVLQVQEDIAESARALKEAQDDANRTQLEGAEAVAEAQYQLARAINNASEAMDEFGDASDAAGQKAANAFDKLNPAAQQFARFLFSLKPQMDALKDSAGSQLFPALETGIRNLLPLLPMLNDMFARTGGVIGQVVVRGTELMASGPFSADMQALGNQNIVTIERMGEVFLALMNIVRNLMVTAMPLVDWFTDMVVRMAAYIDNAVAVGRETGRLTEFFERTQGVLTTLGHILRNFGLAMFEIFRAGVPLGNDLLASLERITAGWVTWLRAVEGQNALRNWFNDSRGVLHELGLLLGDLSRAFAGMGAGPEMAGLISQIRTELLPALVRLVELGGRAFSEQFIETTVRVLELFGQLAGNQGPLIIFLDVLGKVFGAFAWALENIPGMHELVTVLLLFRAALAVAKVMDFILGLGSLVNFMTKFSIVAKAATVAQWLWNVALTANPIGVIIMAVAALVAALIWVLDKTGALGKIWEWLKDVGGNVFGFLKDFIGGALNFLKDNFLYLLGPIGFVIKHFDDFKRMAGAAAEWVVDRLAGLVDFVRGIPGRIGEFLGNIPDIIKGPFKAGLNGIIWLLNRFIDVALAPLHVLNAIPGLGKVIPDVPRIPQLATGGTIRRSGFAIVGERGPELAYMPAGTHVWSNQNTARAFGNTIDLSDYLARSGGSNQPVAPPAPRDEKPPLTVNQTFHNSRVDAQGSADAIHWLLKTRGA